MLRIFPPVVIKEEKGIAGRPLQVKPPEHAEHAEQDRQRRAGPRRKQGCFAGQGRLPAGEVRGIPAGSPPGQQECAEQGQHRIELRQEKRSGERQRHPVPDPLRPALPSGRKEQKERQKKQEKEHRGPVWSRLKIQNLVNRVESPQPPEEIVTYDRGSGAFQSGGSDDFQLLRQKTALSRCFRKTGAARQLIPRRK